ncbi:hypothetical protein ACS5PU_03860 [Pedobacter sp. GSP4]|uniref:hypothetical protein n=1 Tax=Pedobacter sp. GSP4 TaxID=3453716 RepID=UPI003EEA5E5C
MEIALMSLSMDFGKLIVFPKRKWFVETRTTATVKIAFKDQILRVFLSLRGKKMVDGNSPDELKYGLLIVFPKRKWFVETRTMATVKTAFKIKFSVFF